MNELERLSELMALTPENLAQKQHKVLQDHIVEVLRQIAAKTQKNDFETISTMTTDDGDIDFGYNGSPMPFSDIIGQLQVLSEKSGYTQKTTSEIQEETEDE